MNNYDGGPAYPRPVSQGEMGQSGSQRGMSLRDRFAIEAMGPLISASVSGEVDDFGAEEIASESYLYADAMIKARES